MSKNSQPVRARLVNPVARAILRSPLHRMLSGSILALTYTGRRSNRSHVLPVMYAAEADELIVIVGDPESKTWWRNFDGHTRRISVRLRGRELTADARLLTEGTHAHSQTLSVYQKRFPKALAQGMTERLEQLSLGLIDRHRHASRPRRLPAYLTLPY